MDQYWHGADHTASGAFPGAAYATTGLDAHTVVRVAAESVSDKKYKRRKGLKFEPTPFSLPLQAESN